MCKTSKIRRIILLLSLAVATVFLVFGLAASGIVGYSDVDIKNSCRYWRSFMVPVLQMVKYLRFIPSGSTTVFGFIRTDMWDI